MMKLLWLAGLFLDVRALTGPNGHVGMMQLVTSARTSAKAKSASPAKSQQVVGTMKIHTGRASSRSRSRFTYTGPTKNLFSDSPFLSTMRAIGPGPSIKPPVDAGRWTTSVLQTVSLDAMNRPTTVPLEGGWIAAAAAEASRSSVWAWSAYNASRSAHSASRSAYFASWSAYYSSMSVDEAWTSARSGRGSPVSTVMPGSTGSVYGSLPGVSVADTDVYKYPSRSAYLASWSAYYSSMRVDEARTSARSGRGSPVSTVMPAPTGSSVYGSLPGVSVANTDVYKYPSDTLALIPSPSPSPNRNPDSNPTAGAVSSTNGTPIDNNPHEGTYR